MVDQLPTPDGITRRALVPVAQISGIEIIAFNSPYSTPDPQNLTPPQIDTKPSDSDFS